MSRQAATIDSELRFIPCRLKNEWLILGAGMRSVQVRLGPGSLSTQPTVNRERLPGPATLEAAPYDPH